MSVTYQSLGATPASADRRRTLLAWMRERPTHQNLTARQIVDVSGIYGIWDGYERCYGDLMALAVKRIVFRDDSRPIRWIA